TATLALSTLSLHDALPIFRLKLLNLLLYRLQLPLASPEPKVVCDGPFRRPRLRRILLHLGHRLPALRDMLACLLDIPRQRAHLRSEEHTSELQSRENLVCR